MEERHNEASSDEHCLAGRRIPTYLALGEGRSLAVVVWKL